MTERNAHGLTALHYACNNSYFDVICILLKRGSSLDETDVNGVTAFDKLRDDTIKRRVLEFEKSLHDDGNGDICADICKMIANLIP